MGVLEFFGTLIKNDITSSSIKSNFTEKMNINHLFLDFNSIIHVSSQKILADINSFLQAVLKNLYNHRAVNGVVFTEKFQKYKMDSIQKNINQNSKPEDVIKLFKEHFTDKYLDKLIITLVINTVLHIVKTYCNNKAIQTLLLAIDGVPSKGKMVEQRQRRYMGAITEHYKKLIWSKYQDYLMAQPDYMYLYTGNNIKWSRNKITPGTAFMHKLVNYLRSDKIQEKLLTNRKQMKIIISDMYEVGEGEKKIVNYVSKYLTDTTDSVMIYSPDADMILLCMLLPVNKLYMLRYNQQSFVYDLIDVRMLKNNISYYINNNPQYSKENFDINRINYDIVCISTLFGNDFVPKVETINVKKGFQNIMDAYLQTLLKLKDKGYYLVKMSSDDTKKFKLNLTFFKLIIKFLLKEEDDFIKHNHLYGQYINLGQIKNVFDYVEINSENLVSTYQQFKNEYEDLKNLIRNNGNYLYYETNDYFMSSLKKSVNVIIDNESVNTTYLTNKEMIKVLQNYYKKYRDFPRLNINLNTYSHSIEDQYHKNNVKGMNNYEKELYKFDKMLDEYYIKFNAQPLSLTKKDIPKYYEEYFDVKLYTDDKPSRIRADKSSTAKYYGSKSKIATKSNSTKTKFGSKSMASKKNIFYGGSDVLTPDANKIMHDYLEGTLWVFDYYFNDRTYINTWYYQYERAPLLTQFSMYLENIDLNHFNEIFDGLSKYQVADIKKYFNPIEQLIYVSPMTPDIIKLLPANYRDFVTSDNLNPFFENYFVDIDMLTDRLWNQKISKEVDCHSIIYFNKCLVKAIVKPTSSDDQLFLREIRKVEPSETSDRRSKSKEPPY